MEHFLKILDLAPLPPLSQNDVGKFSKKSAIYTPSDEPDFGSTLFATRNVPRNREYLGNIPLKKKKVNKYKKIPSTTVQVM